MFKWMKRKSAAGDEASLAPLQGSLQPLEDAPEQPSEVKRSGATSARPPMKPAHIPVLGVAEHLGGAVLTPPTPTVVPAPQVIPAPVAAPLPAPASARKSTADQSVINPAGQAVVLPAQRTAPAAAVPVVAAATTVLSPVRLAEQPAQDQRVGVRVQGGVDVSVQPFPSTDTNRKPDYRHQTKDSGVHYHTQVWYGPTFPAQIESAAAIPAQPELAAPAPAQTPAPTAFDFPEEGVSEAQSDEALREVLAQQTLSGIKDAQRMARQQEKDRES